jgi:alkanesulfonate monooxygenase SsuD/methylene tetrahydromethanopterin reductase-like flavin-dependent oxidoreductase (luciferase family)
MKFGAFDHMDQGELGLGDQYEERLRLIEAYEKSGWFHAFHLAEHHGSPIGLAPSPAIFLASIAQRTTTLRFGPMVFCLAGYHPYRLYEEICMLDHISGGRLELGIGRGASPIELSFLGIADLETANAMYAESFDVLMRAFEGGQLNFAGAHYTFDKVPIVMRPVQEPHPPFWYGISSPDTTVWAAKHRVNLLTGLKAAGARAIHDRYQAEWAKAGNDPHEFPFFGSNKHIVIADTDAEALALARPAYEMYTENTGLLWKQRNIPQAWVADFDTALAGGLIFAGSPRTVRDTLAKFIEESGINYLAARVAFGNLTFEQSMQSLELLTSKVFPDLAELTPAAS